MTVRGGECELAENTTGPRFSIYTIKSNSKSLVVQAYLNNRQYHLSMDTVAKEIIMIKNILRKSFIKSLVKNSILGTATRDRTIVHGETQI